MAATHFTDPNVCNWWTEGVKTGTVPSPILVGTLLADSGTLPAGSYNLRFCLASTVGVFIQIEWWDVSGVPVLVQSFALAVQPNVAFCDDLAIRAPNTPQLKITTLSPSVVGSMQGTFFNT